MACRKLALNYIGASPKPPSLATLDYPQELPSTRVIPGVSRPRTKASTDSRQRTRPSFSAPGLSRSGSSPSASCTSCTPRSSSSARRASGASAASRTRTLTRHTTRRRTTARAGRSSSSSTQRAGLHMPPTCSPPCLPWRETVAWRSGAAGTLRG